MYVKDLSVGSYRSIAIKKIMDGDTVLAEVDFTKGIDVTCLENRIGEQITVITNDDQVNLHGILGVKWNERAHAHEILLTPAINLNSGK